jgi:RNA polymerase sigma-54 factor
MKNSLQLKLSQHLALTPQLQQSIRLLQLSTLELNQELERFLMENPLLERAEGWNEDPPATPGPVHDATPAQQEAPATESGSPPDEAASSDRWEGEDHWSMDGQAGNWKDGDDDSEYPPQAAAAPSLIDHLFSQLRLLQLSDRDLALCSVLLAHLDEEGYLGTSLDDLQQQQTEVDAVDIDELQVALRLVQSLDPPGVGARSLGECLAIQLASLPTDMPGRLCALEIARSHLNLLANRDYLRLRKQLSCDEAALRQAQKLIAHCNPRPAADFNRSEARYVVPDVVVKKVRNRWLVNLNPDAMPKLRINRMYADILNRSREHGGQMSAQLQEARWLIKNVQQRFETILKVSQAIVERQRHFFEHGEVAMRPLVLREIADTVGLHESTVSRVTTQKFMLTPRGIFELKYFFSSHVGTDTGGAASSTAIRALIKQLISAEDCRKPLSDSRISDILAQQGIVVARRTVAKYREAMQIHPASQRKSL